MATKTSRTYPGGLKPATKDVREAALAAIADGHSPLPDDIVIDFGRPEVVYVRVAPKPDPDPNETGGQATGTPVIPPGGDEEG